jgi:hypothetical protein
MSITEMNYAQQIAERQLELPGLDGYTAEKLAVTLSGGVEFTDVTQREDVEFVKSLRLGQEVRLAVTATVTGKGFKLTPARDDMTDDKTAFGVALKVHTLEVA